MGPYVETSESATPTLLVLPQEPNLVRTTLCGVDPSSYGLTAIPRVQPGEPVAGNPLGGFCEGGRAQERCSRPVPTHLNRHRPVLVWRHIAFDSLVPAQCYRREGAFQSLQGDFGCFVQPGRSRSFRNNLYR